MKITIINDSTTVKIFIDKILHVSYNVEDFKGLRSYIVSKKESTHLWYYIDIYMCDGTTITLDYNSKAKWVKVLELLNSVI